MPYTILKKFELSEKYQITKDFNKNRELVLSLPKVKGVYILTADRDFERLRGKSNILYIGRSNNLQRRIRYLLKHYLPAEFASNWGKHTARKALSKILEEIDIQVFIQYVSCSNYKEIETKLLQKYCQNHIETPPLNNQRK